MEPSPTINKKKKEDPAQLRPKEEEADAGEHMRVTYDLYRAYNMQSMRPPAKTNYLHPWMHNWERWGRGTPIPCLILECPSEN
eukprot:scaffold748_cov329-Pavlova_lutheri.AAC.26